MTNRMRVISAGLLALAKKAGVPARSIGRTGGERLVIGPDGGEPWIDATVPDLRALWERAIPRRLEVA